MTTQTSKSQSSAIEELLNKAKAAKQLHEADILATFTDLEGDEAQAFYGQLEELGIEVLEDEEGGGAEVVVVDEPAEEELEEIEEEGLASEPVGLVSPELADVLAAPRDRRGVASKEKSREIAKRVGTRTLYWLGDRWVDADYDKEMTTTKVEAFSEAYFKLVRDHPELGKCFALGERVVVVVDGQAFETVPPPAAESDAEDPG